MGIVYWIWIVLFLLFVCIWVGEYISRIAGTRRLLLFVASVTDPVRRFAWRIGCATRDFVYRVWVHIYDAIQWIDRVLYDFCN